ncbi:hypothetical protein Syun_026391 [Stephania yunnanensis]|uniref:C2H2-type domain-containing protein n=1 Tax=Stephania yunnanensis TaxID=152371 RepID=A0AAP0HWN7_9MAGN
MIKGLIIQDHHPVVLVEENMSNITSTSGEGSLQPQHSFGSSSQQSQQSNPANSSNKKKRNLPGNPDPDAEVVALSPKTLMATNRFVCEICNKGFQRDQNLQLHRRGHNLPWKLKQRTSKEVKKKVYVCPEPSCVHHDPSRALGDLTGIKKHFCRKHGEKKWKCDKCSKRYAVQSDWKAHSKTCGTREYRCDCGTLFSRRDSFITHRAFCDALAEESARAMTANPLLIPSQTPTTSTTVLPHHHLNLHNSSQFINTSSTTTHHHQDLQPITFKREQHQLQQQQQHINLSRSSSELPPWLACTPIMGPGPGPGPPPHIADLYSPRQLIHHHDQEFSDHQSHESSSTLQNPHHFHHHQQQQQQQQPSLASPHMSATALLQKAAQMGATMSKPSSTSSAPLLRPHHNHQPHHMSANTTGGVPNNNNNNNPSLLQDMMNMSSLSSSSGGGNAFDGASFEDAFIGGMLNSSKRAHDREIDDHLSKSSRIMARNADEGVGIGVGGGGSGGGGNDGLTRDFLGLRAFPSHREILNIAAFEQCMSSTSSTPYHEQQQQQQQQHHHHHHRHSEKQWP